MKGKNRPLKETATVRRDGVVAVKRRATMRDGGGREAGFSQHRVAVRGPTERER